jgi:hypothetical protein
MLRFGIGKFIALSPPEPSFLLMQMMIERIIVTLGGAYSRVTGVTSIEYHGRREPPTSKEGQMESKCANCPMREKAEKNPRGILAILWRFHTLFCPEWKAYQRELAKAKP